MNSSFVGFTDFEERTQFPLTFHESGLERPTVAWVSLCSRPKCSYCELALNDDRC
jgi:hypothetical protein